MSWHDASHTGFSVFINKENLAFSLPLIAVCSIYAYFKYVPLNLGLSIIGAGIVIYKAASSIKARAIEKKEFKIANLDEKFLQELAADELEKEKSDKQKAAKKKQKADNKVLQRIAAEKKKFKTGGTTSKVEEEEEDDEDVSAFVKKNRNKKRN